MRRLGALVLVLALLGGCSAVITDPNAGSIRDITMGVDDEGVPTLEHPEGLEYSKVETRVIENGGMA
jgi:hypothetical protein